MSARLPKLANAKGCVTLVGAGPGDAELLTLKAVKALQSADVILFDALVSDDVLDLARKKAKRMLVGKRGGKPSCKQADINAMMLKLARQGKHVVRLKSGDPAIFGRAGEEMSLLEEHGIPVSIVPGITSASALAAALGISLTHRDYAQSLRLVTGHSRHGGLPDDLDWRGLADAKTTLVVYMGGGTSVALAQKLMSEGMARATPVAVVASVSRAEEQRWFGTLGELGSSQAIIEADMPVLIGIGLAFSDCLAERGVNPQLAKSNFAAAIA
jgi:uroporphyrin-III C-methyltransferase / precorrin-2 dehydrogenase / sirohydrochlorin ferrochelatase